MIITVMSNRGGVGKTTMATIIAELAFSRLLSQGKIDGAENPTPLICALDFDRQHNLLDNFTKLDTQTGEVKKLYELFRKKPKVTEADFLDYITVKPMKRKDFTRDLLFEEAAKYCHFVIDTPPTLDAGDIVMLEKLSDLIVVPFRFERVDYGSMKPILTILKHLRDKCIVVLLKNHFRIPKGLIFHFMERLFYPYDRADAIRKLCRNYIEIPLYTQVAKNVYLKNYYSKGLRQSQKAAYAELEKAIFDS